MPKKIVVFADGTGNAFSTQESNVWRLYQALDTSEPDQIAYYIKGVGTSAVGVLAAIDGATGAGVPSNVRKLYRFLCWNWQPGDDIYLFGFSRGAFTIRTLIGLVDREGLVPTTIGDEPVSHDEMVRHSVFAWRAYRKKTTPWSRSLPTIWVARMLRDAWLSAYHAALRHRSYRAVAEETAAQKRVGITIGFLGLFDTVEAFGVPVEELRLAVDWAIWPISFRNRVLSGTVRCARHALSLDDERTTFHPIRFDVTHETTDRIREVWFVGVHSDVGGGYPDGELAYVPLTWMAEEAEGKGLRFKEGALDGFRAKESALGPRHDSRAGVSVFYRYDPRVIASDVASGGAPVIHHSVAERMVYGSDNYAPITLPSVAKVLMPDGATHVIDGFRPSARLPALAASPPRALVERRTEQAEKAVQALGKPDGALARRTLETVWWRRVVYFAMLGAVALLALWPWLAGVVVSMVGLGFAKDAVDRGNSALSAALGSVAEALGGLVPSYLQPWVDALTTYPVATIILVLFFTWLWQLGGGLGERIHDRARLAWTHPYRKAIADTGDSVALRFAGCMRSPGPRLVYRGLVTFVFPTVVLLAIAALCAIVVGRSWFTVATGWGSVCEAQFGAVLVEEDAVVASVPFPTDSPCWPSGLAVEKDRKYRIWIEVEDPWFDRTIMSGVDGFRGGGFRHVVALPLRRWLTAEWFQPVLRIGSPGMTEWPLVPVDGSVPDQLPHAMPDGRKISTLEDDLKFEPRAVPLPGRLEPLSGEALAIAREVWQKLGLRRRLVADFVAPAAGDLYLYVNDAVFVLPFIGRYDTFYRNNGGRARVLVQRLPLPPPPK